MLTPKQQRFVAEYLKDLNATQAAIRAGYSAKTAEQQGYQLLQKTSVAEAVAEGQRQHTHEAGVTAQKVIGELSNIAFALAEERTSDRLKALELLGKHLVLFTEKQQHTGSVYIPTKVIHEYQPASS